MRFKTTTVQILHKKSRASASCPGDHQVMLHFTETSIVQNNKFRTYTDFYGKNKQNSDFLRRSFLENLRNLYLRKFTDISCIRLLRWLTECRSLYAQEAQEWCALAYLVWLPAFRTTHGTYVYSYSISLKSIRRHGRVAYAPAPRVSAYWRKLIRLFTIESLNLQHETSAADAPLKSYGERLSDPAMTYFGRSWLSDQ
jgi:hypothetical protein